MASLHLSAYSRIFVVTLFAALLTGCGGCVQSPKPSTVARAGVVFFGDSIFGRWNLEADFPGKGYINGGMYGYRTDQLLAILPAVLSGEKVCHGLAGNDTAPLVCQSIPAPATIVIEAGWNNFFQGNNGNTSPADIANMVKIAQDNGVRVIVTTVYAYDTAHPQPWMVPTGSAPVTFYDMWRTPLNTSIAKTKGATVIDLSGMFAGQSDYTIDGVHPTDTGYAQMRDLLNRSL